MPQLYAIIDGFEIPPQALQQVVILGNKISLTGDVFGGKEIAALYSWLSNNRRMERRVSYIVENEDSRAQGYGTLKYIARGGKTDESGARVKFRIILWL